MLRLRPYKPCDADVITTWLKSEYAFRQWSADRYEKYPIKADDMNAYYDKDKNNPRIFGLTAFNDNGILGHLTMRYPKDTYGEIRIGFVIIDNSRRRNGLGKEMLSLAIKYAFEILMADKISLGVFENNIPAIKCYTSCGFKEVKTETAEHYKCMGEVWNCIEMELRSEDYFA